MGRITEIDILAHKSRSGKLEVSDGIDDEHSYVALINGKFHRGHFHKEWYGFFFMSPGFAHYASGGVQYDPPNDNMSDWQKMWRIDDPTIPAWMSGDAILLLCGLDPIKIRAGEERPMAERVRAHCIRSGCMYCGMTITEASPIEAYLYDSEIPKMPGPDGDLIDEDNDE